MEVHELLLLAWAIVFALWLFKQFSASNRRYEERQRQEQ